jgi:putative ABC transport system permease protein
MQFLVEAVTLSLIGGTIGILFGAGMSLAIAHFVEFLPTRITWWSVALAFLFSVNVGIFFGVYPARKAAHYDPIIALRYE